MAFRRRLRVRIAGPAPEGHGTRNESPKTSASEDRSELRARTGASGSQGNNRGPERAGVET